MDDEAKVQNVLLVFVVVAIFDVIIGSIIGPTTKDEDASGFTGYRVETFNKNWYSDYRLQDGIKHTFFTTFAVFFPSVTGIQAGANISGDLKDPSNAIPKGTLWSIVITITSYIIMVVVSGSVNLREASGFTNELQNGTYTNCTNRTCTQGLYNNENLLIQTISWSSYLVYLGCFAATLSTALTSLIAIPKILKRMGQDNVFPFLKYLVKGYGESNEPYRAHYLAVIVSSTFLLLMGELNTIASFISIIYLCAYALLNVCTFHAAHFKPSGWRPAYRFYNKWLSLAGAVICFVVMFLVDRSMPVIIACFMSTLYFAAARRTHGINWGSSIQAQQIKTAIKHVYKANAIQHHVKNYVPNIMVLSGTPESRKELVYLAYLMTKNNGLQTCVNVKREKLNFKQIQDARQKGAEWLNREGVKSLYSVLDDVDLDVAVRLMICSCGRGILKPNIVLVGYKNDWLSSAAEDVQTYLSAIHVANVKGLAALIVRLPDVNRVDDAKSTLEKNMPTRENDTERYRKIENGEESESIIKGGPDNNPFSFVKNRHSGCVDVWWMFEDGGLALTIAHILMSSDAWKKCKFRIFGVTNENLEKEKIRLKQLLIMYRVRFDVIKVVSKHPTTLKTETHFEHFKTLRKQYSQGHGQNLNENENYDTKSVIDSLFIRDLLEAYSSESNLIIMTSSFNINKVFDQIHMRWMETVTRELPPCIIVQGNVIQTVTASA